MAIEQESQDIEPEFDEGYSPEERQYNDNDYFDDSFNADEYTKDRVIRSFLYAANELKNVIGDGVVVSLLDKIIDAIKEKANAV